jgi:hypothetical protein
VARFFRRLDAGRAVPDADDYSPPTPPHDPTARERHLAEVKRQIKAGAFRHKDFFLTQEPPPVWTWQNAVARARWKRREEQRKRIARLLAFFGFTAHDLVPKNSELRIVVGVGDGRMTARRETETTDMDMSKYAGGNFLKVADLQEQGPFRAKIIDVEIGEKFGKPNITLSEGSTLSINATNCGTLIRSYGADSDDWLNKEIELYVGETDYKGEMVPTILIKPITPSPENKKTVNKAAMKKKPGSGPDMDDKIPSDSDEGFGATA